MKNNVGAILFLSLFIAIAYAHGQNLVINPGFEDYQQCPHRSWTELRLSQGWKDPAGTADYFNTCRDTSMTKNGQPAVEIFLGDQSPHSGAGFAGFFLFEEKNFYDREYIQASLLTPLKKGESYNVKFYLSIGEKVRIYSNHISLCFSEIANLPFTGTNKSYPHQKDSLDRHGITLSCKERIQLKVNNALRSTQWQLVETLYTAKGGEQHLTFGSFKEDMTPKQHAKLLKENLNYTPPERTVDGVKVLLGTFKSSYYYIDDVSVIPTKKASAFSHQKEE